MTENEKSIKHALLIGIFTSAFLTSGGSLFAQTTPPERCVGYGNLDSILLADWEDGIGPWTADTYSVADPLNFDTPDWESVGDLPDNRSGMAAFVANLDIGDCSADDESGVLTLSSPQISIPDNAEVPRISVEHWFETEAGWDGGNIKISVNGGPFNIVPASAFEYGPHNDILFPALDDGFEYNTNPLAEQEAFTGTIDGSPSGSWMESRINLLGIAAAGDTIELRFDFGIDGCDGAVGWYVDEVEVYSCAAELPPSDCGNGVLDTGEQCDDGNDFIEDGCSNVCQIESGWQCTAPTPPAAIEDPGFEAGRPNPSWTESSNNFLGSPICDVATCNTGGGSGPSDGTYWVWFGGSKSLQESSVSQSVVIPSSVSQLAFDLEIPACDSSSDYFEVLIDGNRELLVNGSDSRCGNTGYVTQTVDISAYADGLSHDIEFYSETFSENGEVSSFFIDNVSAPGTPSMCTPQGPSLTLVKKVINDDGGTAVPANWTLTATGPSSFSGAGPNVSSGEGFTAGAYKLSESGDTPGYTASDWVCDGGTQIDGNTVELAQGESATCTITNDDDALTTEQINAGHSGAWFNPETSGQGVLVDLDPAQKFMFIAWFTYTDDASDNPFEQRWLTAQGNYAGNSATLDLFETLGGKFDAPQEVTTTKVGEVSLQFDSCIEGEMTYTIEDENLQGSFPLIRVIPGSESTCLAIGEDSTQAIDINAGMDGAWFEPATSGQGFLIDTYPNDTSGDFMFVAWFTYGDDTSSGQRWLTAQGGFEGPTATLTLYETTGGSFDDPKVPETVEAGTLTIDFVNCSNAELSYSITGDDLEDIVSIQRVLPDAKVLCEEISGTE